MPGVRPGPETSPAAIGLLREAGIPTSAKPPRPVSKELVGRANVIVAFGCLSEIPPGGQQRRIDWQVPGGMGRTDTERTAIRDEITRRVHQLMGELGRDDRAPPTSDGA